MALTATTGHCRGVPSTGRAIQGTYAKSVRDVSEDVRVCGLIAFQHSSASPSGDGTT